MMRSLLFSLRCRDFGIFLLRVVLGLAFIYHGYGKIFSPEKWAWLGSQMPLIEYYSFMKPSFGFLASISEFFGGILLILGLGTRIASILISFTMFVAFNFHLSKNEAFELPLMYALVLLSLCFINSDKFSLDHKLQKN